MTLPDAAAREAAEITVAWVKAAIASRVEVSLCLPFEDLDARIAAALRERDERIETEKRIANGWAECSSHECGNCVWCLTARVEWLEEENAGLIESYRNATKMMPEALERIEALEGALKRARLTFSDLGADGSVARIDAALAPPPSRESQV